MKHKPWCDSNLQCLVYHADGKCPGYKPCNCGVDSPTLPTAELHARKTAEMVLMREQMHPTAEPKCYCKNPNVVCGTGCQCPCHTPPVVEGEWTDRIAEIMKDCHPAQYGMVVKIITTLLHTERERGREERNDETSREASAARELGRAEERERVVDVIWDELIMSMPSSAENLSNLTPENAKATIDNFMRRLNKMK